ncbi:hypothetical protein SGFS_065580 [Streptomyces graminofaciens]|uniref:Uncharacterized protein n=1 Tax=Streptomyces graminofaciens TaxID=68212 RepID=A0ABM7FFD9_9ACTN|nr:hypothetical protein [Streptomyces graminofaciens]BBC35264.1 hypothetical protein SGFS_065580 [Streptomyces graminofaciens]
MTNPTAPGADELRIRYQLRRILDQPERPPMPPGPPPDGYQATRERDWLDDIADLDFGPEPTPEPAPASKDSEPESVDKPRPEPAPAKPRRRPTIPKPDPDDPRQSLLDAWDRTPRRLKWLIFHATAAAPGWVIGWVDWATDTAAWYAAGHWTSSSAWVLYGLGGCALALYRRSRWWAWPFAWLAAVPVSSVVVGVLLYGTGYQP